MQKRQAKDFFFNAIFRRPGALRALLRAFGQERDISSQQMDDRLSSPSGGFPLTRKDKRPDDFREPMKKASSL